MLIVLRTYMQHIPGSLSAAAITVPFSFLFCSRAFPAGIGELTYEGSALAGPKSKARRLQAGTTGTWGVGKEARRILQEMEVVSRA